MGASGNAAKEFNQYAIAEGGDFEAEVGIVVAEKFSRFIAS